jgi:hypothetical protein
MQNEAIATFAGRCEVRIIGKMLNSIMELTKPTKPNKRKSKQKPETKPPPPGPLEVDAADGV